MATDEVVAKLLSEDHVDLLRESLRWVVQQMMEAEVSELIGAGHGDPNPGSGDPPQRISPEALGYPGQRDRPADPEAAPGRLLPLLPRAEEAIRAGAPERGAAGLRLRGVDPQGRPAGRVARPADLAVGGLADLGGPRRADRGFPRQAAGRELSLFLARRQGREGPRRRPGAAQGPGDRPRRARVRPARGDRPRRRARPRPRPSGASSCGGS